MGRGSKRYLGTEKQKAHEFSPPPFCPLPELSVGRGLSFLSETSKIYAVPVRIS